MGGTRPVEGELVIHSANHKIDAIEEAIIRGVRDYGFTVVTEDEKTNEISRLLTEWNPLGASTAAINDLSDYETEASDILWAMDLHGDSLEKAVTSVLEEAFLIELKPSELRDYCEKIRAALGN